MKTLFTLKEIAELYFGSVAKMLESDHVGIAFKKDGEDVALINNSKENKNKMQELIESNVKLNGGMIKHEGATYFLSEHGGFVFIS